jgi:ArsR family transcriptional regulator
MNNLLPIFKALSDESRLRILALLRDGEVCVCDMAKTLGMTQPNISFHLSMLKEAGLIKDRKHGRWIHYSLDESDMFRRFLLMSIFEKMDPRTLKKLKRSRKC